MSDLMFFLKGMVAGFIVAAPVGPAGLLCINRTLSGGKRSGFISGLGAVTGDGFYALIAAYSITVISSFISDHRSVMRILGGAFLVYLSFRILSLKPVLTNEKKPAKNYLGDYVSAFGLAMTNPVTVIVFAAMFALFGLGGAGSGHITPALTVAGVITGSTICWGILSVIVSGVKKKMGVPSLRKINICAGALILIFAGAIFLSGIAGARY